ncbi:hypothetical protein Hdeb2414_s0027g00688461 [Helianthus debilis subsp. tardiflorus]
MDELTNRSKRRQITASRSGNSESREVQNLERIEDANGFGPVARSAGFGELSSLSHG